MPVVLSIGKLAAGAEDYYLGSVARGAEEYYDDAGEVPGRWTGGGAHALGLAGRVDPEELRAAQAPCLLAVVLALARRSRRRHDECRDLI